MQELRTVSTVDALVHAIRHRVLSGELPPGAQLREVELAAAYGVGRYSLRTALRVLVEEGLLRHAANRGVFVPLLQRDDVRDLFRLRTALEVEAARIVAAGRIPVPEAERAVERLEALSGDEPWDEVTELDLGFHAAIVAAAGSPRLARAFAAMTSELRLILAQTRPTYDDPDAIGPEHRTILDALTSGRPTAAERAVRAHLEGGVDGILALIR